MRISLESSIPSYLNTLPLRHLSVKCSRMMSSCKSNQGARSARNTNVHMRSNITQFISWVFASLKINFSDDVDFDKVHKRYQREATHTQTHTSQLGNESFFWMVQCSGKTQCSNPICFPLYRTSDLEFVFMCMELRLAAGLKLGLA